VTELTLDDIERHAFSSHPDGMRMTELMRREPAPDASLEGGAAERVRAAGPDHGRPAVGPLITQKSAPTGIRARCEIHGRSCSQPH
jgi:hypothetical protein